MKTSLTIRPHATMLFWLAATLILFLHLGSAMTMQSEDRWLEIAREMLLSGDIWRPALNGMTYFDKPLLSYWLELAAMPLTGGLNEWALRLPSALAALLVLGATISLGKRLWPEEDTGRLAGWILLTCFGFIQWGRLGEADMENVAATTLAIAWYWRCRDLERVRFGNYLLLYLIMAVGAHCKGLVAFVVPLLAIFVDIVRQQRWRAHVNVRHVAAMALALAVYLLPFVLAALNGGVSGSAPTVATATPENAHGLAGLALVFRENIVRYVAPFDHQGPIYTYLIAVPQLMFPWTFVLIAALIWGIRQSRNTLSANATETAGALPSAAANTRWVLFATAAIFVFFTLSGSRRNYYILPLLPYCALLTAKFLHDAADSALARRCLQATLAVLLLAAAAALAVPALFAGRISGKLHMPMPTDIQQAAMAIGALGLCTGIVALAWRKQRWPASLTACLAVSLVAFGGFFGVVQVQLDRFRPELQFAATIRSEAAQLPANRIIYFRGRVPGRLMYYANLPVPIGQPEDARQLEKLLADADALNAPQSPQAPVLLISRVRYLAELPPAIRARKADVAETPLPWEKHLDGEKMLAWWLPARPSTLPASSETAR